MEGLEKPCLLSAHEGTGRQKDYHGAFKKLVRNSEFSKSDNSKNLSVLGQSLVYFKREYVYASSLVRLGKTLRLPKSNISPDARVCHDFFKSLTL